MRRGKQKQTDKYKRNNALLSVAKCLSASRYKSTLLYLPILLIIFVFAFQINDQEAISLYLNKLQKLSVHKISKDQQLWIQNFYLNNKNREPLQAERHKIRDDFNKRRNHLIQQWEAHYKIQWPKEIKPHVSIDKSQQTAIVLKSKQKQKRLQKIEKKDTNKIYNNYQAHHTIPINAGGVNVFWNITPLSSKNHKLLHNSFEEKACFSHEFIHKKVMRFILKIQEIFMDYFSFADLRFGSYINKRDANYAK